MSGVKYRESEAFKAHRSKFLGQILNDDSETQIEELAPELREVVDAIIDYHQKTTRKTPESGSTGLFEMFHSARKVSFLRGFHDLQAPHIEHCEHSMSAFGNSLLDVMLKHIHENTDDAPERIGEWLEEQGGLIKAQSKYPKNNLAILTVLFHFIIQNQELPTSRCELIRYYNEDALEEWKSGAKAKIKVSSDIAKALNEIGIGDLIRGNEPLDN
ncbi:hypothetical protein [Rubritalea marina]|uniref:hypothetical protein n=1 Tax=Rubritalea marina TaxID=361055 RepID=UPI000366871F|nr:hypothetical protein [Rubritalea marina]